MWSVLQHFYAFVKRCKFWKSRNFYIHFSSSCKKCSSKTINICEFNVSGKDNIRCQMIKISFKSFIWIENFIYLNCFSWMNVYLYKGMIPWLWYSFINSAVELIKQLSGEREFKYNYCTSRLLLRENRLLLYFSRMHTTSNFMNVWRWLPVES